MKVPGKAAPAASPPPAIAPIAPIAPIVDPVIVAPLLPSLSPDPILDPSGYVCSVCGSSFPIDKVYDQNGSIICEGCHAAAVNFAGPPEDADPGSFPAVPTLSTLLASPPADEPMLPQQPDAVGIEATQAQAHADTTDDTIAGLTAASESAPRTRMAPEKKKLSMPVLIAGGSVAFVLTGILTYYITRYGGSSKTVLPTPITDTSSPSDDFSAPDQAMSDWERQNAPRLSQWRSTAKGMQVSGDLAGAQMLYKKMLSLSKTPGAMIQNAGIAAMLADAQTNFDIITKKIGPPPAPLAEAPPPLAPPLVPSSASGDTATAPSAAPPENPSTAPAATEPAVSSPATAPVQVADNGPNWEPAHREQLLRLSSDAAALEKQQPVAALAKLQLLLQMVTDHGAPLTDPQLKDAVAAAGVSRKRLLVFARDSDEARAITARSLLAAGLKAEQERKWKTALDSLYDAGHLMSPMLKPVQRYRDPMYLTSLDAAAVAYMSLKQNQRAGELFSDDEPLGRASLAINSPSRDLIWNRAVNDLTQKFNIMRSVKMLHDYMDLHRDPDEPLLNLLGTALFVADESNPANRKVLDDAIGFYTQRSMDLEKTRPGERRWGVQWLSEADAQAKFDQYNKSLDAFTQAVRLKTAAETHEKDVQEAVRARRATQIDANAAKAAVTTAAAAVKAAHDAIPRPPWLTDVQPVIPTLDNNAPMTLVAGAASAPSTASPAAGTSVASSPASPSPSPAPAAAAVVPASQPAVEIVAPAAPQARYAAAFPIDRTHLLTAAEPLGNATTVKIEDTVGGVMSARVVARSDRLALLEVSSADLAAGPLKYLNLATDFTGGPVQCAAIPQANLFGPTVTLLSADAPVPTRSAWWVSLSDHPRLPGSPLLDAQNEVIGVEVASRDDPRQKIPSVTLEDLRKFLESNHIVSVASGSKADPSVVSQVTAESE